MWGQTLTDDLVDDAILLGLLGGHEEVTVRVCKQAREQLCSRASTATVVPQAACEAERECAFLEGLTLLDLGEGLLGRVGHVAVDCRGGINGGDASA